MTKASGRGIDKSSIMIIQVEIIRLVVVIGYIYVRPSILIDIGDGDAQAIGQRALPESGLLRDIDKMSVPVLIELVSREGIQFIPVAGQLHIIDLLHAMPQKKK